VARQLYPDGVLIAGDDLRQALRDTAEVLDRSPQCPVFEATFEHEGVLVRVDLLLPDGEAYRLVEVKSSAAVNDYHLSDAAVQAWVTENAGVPISRMEIAHIDTSFAYSGHGDYHGLLAHADISQGGIGALTRDTGLDGGGTGDLIRPRTCHKARPAMS
jgi:hypothetical protein